VKHWLLQIPQGCYGSAVHKGLGIRIPAGSQSIGAPIRGVGGDIGRKVLVKSQNSIRARTQKSSAAVSGRRNWGKRSPLSHFSPEVCSAVGIWYHGALFSNGALPCNDIGTIFRSTRGLVREFGALRGVGLSVSRYLAAKRFYCCGG
jgi:hypothetical protein